MGNKASKFTRETFRTHLEEMYGCKFIGQHPPLGFAEDGTGPDIFKHPDGDEDSFSVPQPEGANGCYEQWLIERVLRNNNLKPIKSAYAVAEEPTTKN